MSQLTYSEQLLLTLQKYPPANFRYVVNILEVNVRNHRTSCWDGTYLYQWDIFNKDNICVAETTPNLSDGEHSYSGDVCTIYDEDGNAVISEEISFQDYVQNPYE